MGYGPAAAFLGESGYTLAKGTLNKYCSPAWDGPKGPKPAKFWGRRPVFYPSQLLEWAKSRLTDDRKPGDRSLKSEKIKRALEDGKQATQPSRREKRPQPKGRHRERSVTAP